MTATNCCTRVRPPLSCCPRPPWRPRLAAIKADTVARWGDSYGGGGTIYLCAVDADRMGVSLIQSNASGFGAHIFVPEVGVSLHNRGLGFSLVPGHPAEYGPGRRPPHTLAPALVQRADGSLRAVMGTMGGDGQPQIMLQLLARLLHQGQDAGQVIAGPRWTLEAPADINNGFNTWAKPDHVRVVLEDDAPANWAAGLTERGHIVESRDRWNWGHAHLIAVDDDDMLTGAADPRALTSSAASY